MRLIDWSFAGATRWVVFVGPLALKFTWLREYWRGNIYYFSGVRANVREYRRYRVYGQRRRSARIYFSIAVLNVQRRGNAVTQKQLDETGINAGFDDMYLLKYDLLNPGNYCLIDGQVVQCDLGKSNLDEFLKEHYAE